MKKIFCNRCEKETTGAKIKAKVGYKHAPTSEMKLDFCKGCFESFIQWLNLPNDLKPR